MSGSKYNRWWATQPASDQAREEEKREKLKWNEVLPIGDERLQSVINQPVSDARESVDECQLFLGEGDEMSQLIGISVFFFFFFLICIFQCQSGYFWKIEKNNGQFWFPTLPTGIANLLITLHFMWDSYILFTFPISI